MKGFAEDFVNSFARKHDTYVIFDRYNEQSIRYGKSKGGLVGKTLSSEQTAVWVLSHHICNILSLAVDSLFEENTDEDYDKIVNVKIHKEEGDNRRNLDSADRQKSFCLKSDTYKLQPLTHISLSFWCSFGG